MSSALSYFLHEKLPRLKGQVVEVDQAHGPFVEVEAGDAPEGDELPVVVARVVAARTDGCIRRGGGCRPFSFRDGEIYLELMNRWTELRDFG